MKVFLASDHAGLTLKEFVKANLIKMGHEVVDCGATLLDSNDDYPDFISKAALGVVQNPGSFGVFLGKSGAGECMVANKIRGGRAFLGLNEENVKLAREHNDANIISLGSAFVTEEMANVLIKTFLETPFSNDERHVRRINKIKEIEDGKLT